MRLIDADLFKENIRSGLYIFCQENKEDICNAIDDEPTTDTDEIYKKGYHNGFFAAHDEPEKLCGVWICHPDYDYICSNCGNRALEMSDLPYLSTYCPFCGSEMEIEK